jgi:CHAT domain/Bacterial pre-peptidase C-terminal domain
MKNRISHRLVKQTGLFTALLLCLLPATFAHGFINQTQSEIKQLDPGRAIERGIAGGESHSYQIVLMAGQFVRIHLDQRAIDASLILTAPDGKQLIEMDLTRAGDEESLSFEASADGNYRLSVQAGGSAALRGAYQLNAVLKAAATTEDKERVTAESLMIEAARLATHGFLDSERPGLSALVLSMVDKQGKPQNGFLRANDIYNLKLPAELVVLSACQTGLGKDIKGEGLVGLTRGFMYAGAARVVVSLWSVK